MKWGKSQENSKAKKTRKGTFWNILWSNNNNGYI